MTTTDTQARQNYEAAHQRLVDEFGDRLQALVGVSPQEIMIPEGNDAYRAAVIEAGLDLIVPLRRFIEQELALWADSALLDDTAVDVDDVVANTYLAAVDRAETAPVARAFYTWLRRIARREVRNAILSTSERVRMEQSLQAPAYDVMRDRDEEWPAEILQLIDILADPQAVLPEDIMERQEVQAVLARVLVKLPEQWREVFLMRVVDGWMPEEISSVEGLDAQDVDRQLEMSREFLYSWLRQAGMQADDFE